VDSESVAWLSLDPEDDRPQHVWTCAIAALQTVAALGFVQRRNTLVLSIV